MGPITLENVRASSDITVKLRLKDGGMYIAWTSLADIKAYIFSDAQRAIAGRCDVSIDGDDSTLLICTYSANKPQYPGVNSIVIRANYDGRVKTYDRRAFNIVKRTSAVSGDVVLDDPVVDLELEVADVSSSLLDMAIALAFKAVDEWDQVTVTERGPEGKSAYRVAVDNGFVGTEDEWLESLVGPIGPRGRQGADGEPGPAGVTSAEVTVDDTTGTPSAQIAVNDGLLSLSLSGIKGEPGQQGEDGAPGAAGEQGPQGETGATPDFSIGTVSTGAAGSQASATITGTASAPVLNLVIPQGIQGNTGSSVDYPFELVNNETTDDATKAHTAAGAKRLKDELTQLEAEINTLAGNTSLSQEFKDALLDCFRGVAWVGDNGATLIGALNDAMNRASLLRIEATYTQTNPVYPSTNLEDLEEDLVVVAYYSDGTHREITGYTLSGNLSVGTSTITVTYSGKNDTFQVTVSEKDFYSLSDGDLIKLETTTTLNTTNGWYLVGGTVNANRRRSFPMSSGVKSFRLTEDSSTFVDNTDYYPIPIPSGVTSIKVDITPSTQYFAVVISSYNNGAYTAPALLDTGWIQGSYTLSTIPSGATHLSVVSKYDNAGTSYPTEPSDLKITFIKNE